MTRSRLDPVLGELRDRLVRGPRAQGADAAPLRRPPLRRGGQWEFCRQLLGDIGFDFERGRLDSSTHPSRWPPGRMMCA
jgi:Zn-dependent carboxypeptidase